MQVFAAARTRHRQLVQERIELFAGFEGPDTLSDKHRRAQIEQYTLEIKAKDKEKIIVALENEITTFSTPEKVAYLASLKKEQEKLLAQAKKIHTDSKGIRDAFRARQKEIRANSDKMNAAMNEYNGTNSAPERREFIMKCCAEGCRGFLSTAYKCGTCESRTCPDCLVVLGKEKNVAHTCAPDAVESTKLIRNETIPCPKCATRIYKVDGCFSKDTPILLWNGHTKRSQDIRAGDELVGDDGQKRIVQDTCFGEDELYEVSQTRGESYTVNSKHRLALKPYNSITSKGDSFWNVKWFNGSSFSSKSFPEKKEAEHFLEELAIPDILEITVDDYMKLSQATKDLLYGYKAHEIDWPSQEVLVDPYLMGLWLGDGINNGMDFACNPESDPEIVHYLLEWCDKNGCELVHDDAYRFRVRRAGLTQGRDAINHGATSADCKGCAKKKCNLCDLPCVTLEQGEMPKKNPLKEALDYYGLIRNKHIPDEYVVNDRQTRLQLLAGFIDTDGHLGNDGKRIQIPQANHSIAKQIALVARSLGFVVSTGIVKKENISFAGGEPKDYPPHILVSISGPNLSDIPTRIQRKKCHNSQPNKDWFKTSISVKSVGWGEYFGWSVDGNKRFVMNDMTVVRNCNQMWCVMEGCNTAFDWVSGRIITGAVHNPHYYEWLRRTGGQQRETGDIPCGGVPTYWVLLSAFRVARIVPAETEHLEQVQRMLVEMEERLAHYPTRMPQLINKESNVAYLLQDIGEDQWKKQLESTETKFNRKKEIGLILHTLVMAAADTINQVVNRCNAALTTELRIELRLWITETVMPQLDALRTYTNQALKDLAIRNHMAVPQVSDRWTWIPIRAIYKKTSINEVRNEIFNDGSVAPENII